MSNKKIIFAGPSLNKSNYEQYSSLDFLPPCKQGDIFLSILEKPVAIGIIDGFFEGSPSVWHKEILWALDQGIHVFGSASMGALRAAELDGFGMNGIGTIYEWYSDKTIEDDDEVALLHGPEEMNFMPLTVAMVNVRANCSAAVENEIISVETASIICTAAKNIFYKERHWLTVLEKASFTADQTQDINSFGDWLKNHEIEQKSIDAELLCAHIVESDFAKPFESEFIFSETEFWHQNTKLWQREKANFDNRDGKDGYRLFS